MGDAPDKPNPEGFLYLARKLCKDNLGHNNIPIAYVGDTIADINTVNNAKKRIPNQIFISIGVAPPHLHLGSRINDRISYELKLQAGDFPCHYLYIVGCLVKFYFGI